MSVQSEKIKKEIVSIPYEVEMALPDFIEFQLRLIFGKDVKNFSKGELQVLSYLYLYSNISEATDRILEANLRTSRKSVYNDISRFKGLNIVLTEGKQLRFNEDIIVSKSPSVFEIKVKLEV